MGQGSSKSLLEQVKDMLKDDDAKELKKMLKTFKRYLTQPVEKDGSTVFHYAARHDAVKCIDFLFQKKADINAMDKNGCMPIHIAAQHGKIKALRELVNAGVDINVQTSNGNTALIWAAAKSQETAVETLCLLGANPMIKNTSGQTARDVAATEECCKHLRTCQNQWQQNVDAPPSAPTIL